MKTKRTVQVNIECSEFFVRRKTAGTIESWCDVCAAQVRMVRPEAVAKIAGVGLRAVYRSVEEGGLSFFEDQETCDMYICLACFLRRTRA